MCEVPELLDVYRRVYQEPPYLETADDVERFRETLAEHRRLPEFALATVRDRGVLGGFAYGVRYHAGWWHPRALEPAPQWLRGEPLFYVYELAVLPELRGRGHGRALLDRLLGERSERFAVLAASNKAPARELYRRWGWEKVGGLTPGDVDLLALPLAG
jgi:ribosomal protein S18 acetylase RimI-like enzyme